MAIKIKKVGLPALPERPDMDPVLRNKQRLSRANRRLMSLGALRVRELESRLLEGQALTDLAKLIQKDWEQFPAVKELTLIKELQRFRASRVDGKLLYLKDTKYAKQVFGDYANGINVLDELQKLIRIQQERVSKEYLWEQNLSILGEDFRHELELLAKMYSQLLELQMEVGLVKRAPQEVSFEIAASKAQVALENAMQTDRTVESALREAYKIIESEYTVVARQ
jgi:hypothetical protein